MLESIKLKKEDEIYKFDISINPYYQLSENDIKQLRYKVSDYFIGLKEKELKFAFKFYYRPLKELSDQRRPNIDTEVFCFFMPVALGLFTGLLFANPVVGIVTTIAIFSVIAAVCCVCSYIDESLGRKKRQNLFDEIKQSLETKIKKEKVLQKDQSKNPGFPLREILSSTSDSIVSQEDPNEKSQLNTSRSSVSKLLKH